MKKETIFFSHSSRDKEAMNYLKTIIDEKTSGILNIFLSSDGESIPFGTNWIHSIEQGLNEAIIMYVFITPNSIKSDWIYFESGFAYSKGVKVIPVGFGIDICELKPPLNLLQGFNLTSHEGLNNIIKTINDECETKFPESFQESEYSKLEKSSVFYNKKSLQKYIDCFVVELFTDTEGEGENKKEFVPHQDRAYEKIKEIFEKGKCKYAENKAVLLSEGFYVSKVKSTSDKTVLKVSVEPDSLNTHFSKIIELLEVAYDDKNTHYIFVDLEKGYFISDNAIKNSAAFSYDDRFGFSQNQKNGVFPIYQFKDLDFFITKKRQDSESKLRIIFPVKDVSEQVVELTTALYELGIIRRESEI